MFIKCRSFKCLSNAGHLKALGKVSCVTATLSGIKTARPSCSPEESAPTASLSTRSTRREAKVKTHVTAALLWTALGSSIAESYYRVGVLGAPKVGKTALVTRFLASDDDSDSVTVDEEEVARKTVSVLLDGEESLMEFFDDLEEMNLVCPLCNPSNTGSHPSNPQQYTLDQQTPCTVTARNPDITPVADDGRSTCLDINPRCLPPDLTAVTPVMESLTCDNVACHCDAFTVVFSVTDLQSFRCGCQKVRHLREDLGTDRAIILVGNKADLVRKRCVSAKDAMMLACKYDCKYIETSAVFGHQTDELLVGILRQISRRLSTPPGHHDDEDITDAARKRSKWRKLSKLRKFLEKATKTKDPCCDILT
ncbi:uncharacterized protein LOC112553136 [Pomacea canaliculata]|uniref:uncharacterized protein LOC112553136 n=1 Tax=Pomacea canaliculata TaxID=400727 RepID=UPI000D732CCA|nr:uncharacterized protein LOC112553136 [Pomacea canaliculata]